MVKPPFDYRLRGVGAPSRYLGAKVGPFTIKRRISYLVHVVRELYLEKNISSYH